MPLNGHWVNRNLTPQDDRSRIDCRRDIVNRGAGHWQSPREGVSHRSRAAQGGKASKRCVSTPTRSITSYKLP